jgi:TolB protein
MFLLALPGTAVLMIGTALAAPAPEEPPPEELILFSSKKDGVYQLFVMKPDGTKLKQLTKGESDHRSPAWSPDGKRIVYETGTPFERMHLWVMNANGTGAKQITDGDVLDRTAAWSPDGKKLLFARRAAQQGRDHEVCVMDFARGKPGKVVNLTKHKAWDSDPAWSPDGKKIAFCSNRDEAGGYHLYVMDADGRNAKAITERAVSGGFVYPAWSPDGKKIAFTDNVRGGKEIFVCDADGKNRRQLTKQGGQNHGAVWSPKGDRIVFQHHESTTEEADGVLYIVDVKSGKTTRLGKDLACPREGGRPAWRPTGKGK